MVSTGTLGQSIMFTVTVRASAAAGTPEGTVNIIAAAACSPASRRGAGSGQRFLARRLRHQPVGVQMFAYSSAHYVAGLSADFTFFFAGVAFFSARAFFMDRFAAGFSGIEPSTLVAAFFRCGPFSPVVSPPAFPDRSRHRGRSVADFDVEDGCRDRPPRSWGPCSCSDRGGGDRLFDQFQVIHAPEHEQQFRRSNRGDCRRRTSPRRYACTSPRRPGNCTAS